MIRKVLAAATLSLLTSMSAQAEFYVGGGVGFSEPDDSTLSNHTSYKILAGYQFIDYLALEASVVNIGRLTVDSTSITPPAGGTVSSTSLDLSGYELAIIGILPLIEKVHLFGKIGYFAWDSQLNANVASPNPEPPPEPTTIVARQHTSDDGQDPSFGIGVSMDPIERLSLNLEYTQYDILEDKVEYFGLGMKVKF